MSITVKLNRKRKEDSLRELEIHLVKRDYGGFHPGLKAVIDIMSKDEIDGLLRITYKATALGYLNEARENSRFCDVDSSIGNMYRFLRKGNFSIEDIRTTDDELERLKRTGYLSAAKDYLKQARDGYMSVRSCLESLEKAGLSLDALVGVKKEEIKELLKKSD